MAMKKIFYRYGYKYQLAANYYIRTGFSLPDAIISDFICMTSDGDLTICSGYAFDGPSGPVIDVREFMRASLVHDALYQLMRKGMLPQSFKKKADSNVGIIPNSSPVTLCYTTHSSADCMLPTPDNPN